MRGKRGADGRAGAPGPRIIRWETADNSFTAVPLLSDGRKGAALHSGACSSNITPRWRVRPPPRKPTRLSPRAEVERGAEAVRQGLPPR